MEVKWRRVRPEDRTHCAYRNQFCQFKFKLVTGLLAWIKVKTIQWLHRKTIDMISSRRHRHD